MRSFFFEEKKNRKKKLMEKCEILTLNLIANAEKATSFYLLNMVKIKSLLWMICQALACTSHSHLRFHCV